MATLWVLAFPAGDCSALTSPLAWRSPAAPASLGPVWAGPLSFSGPLSDRWQLCAFWTEAWPPLVPPLASKLPQQLRKLLTFQPFQLSVLTGTIQPGHHVPGLPLVPVFVAPQELCSPCLASAGSSFVLSCARVLPARPSAWSIVPGVSRPLSTPHPLPQQWCSS